MEEETITLEPTLVSTTPNALLLTTIVSNQFPTKPSSRRICVIGDAPSHQDLSANRPFSGAAGSLLTKFLAQVGIDRDACFLGNVCQHRVAGKWDSPEMVAGRAHLELDLLNYQPDICILLGNLALRAFSGEPRTISNWRGSVFQATDMAAGCKCIATYPPAMVLKDYALTGVCRFDYQRAAREAKTGWTPPPADRIEIDLCEFTLLNSLKAIREARSTVAIDIEGHCTGISCIGFATNAKDCFVVPFSRQDGSSYWTEDQEVILWEAIQQVLEDPAIVKVCHNALYELFCLGWYGIAIRGHIEDTMLLSHELHAELEKSLGFIASLYTPHPYWKGERKTADDRVALFYNGKDCCRTYECWQTMLPKLKPKQLEHYRTNLACLIPTAYQTLRGLAFNKAEARLRYKANQRLIYEKQDAINQTAVATRPDLAFPANMGQVISSVHSSPYSPSPYSPQLSVVPAAPSPAKLKKRSGSPCCGKARSGSKQVSKLAKNMHQKPVSTVKKSRLATPVLSAHAGISQSAKSSCATSPLKSRLLQMCDDLQKILQNELAVERALSPKRAVNRAREWLLYAANSLS